MRAWWRTKRQDVGARALYAHASAEPERARYLLDAFIAERVREDAARS